jgi:hypothetical protein
LVEAACPKDQGGSRVSFEVVVKDAFLKDFMEEHDQEGRLITLEFDPF